MKKVPHDPDCLTEKQVAFLKQPGLWLLFDPGHPDELVPVWSRDGVLHAMRLDQVLRPDKFIKGTKFAGPFWADVNKKPMMITRSQQIALTDLLTSVLTNQPVARRWVDCTVNPPQVTTIEDLMNLFLGNFMAVAKKAVRKIKIPSAREVGNN